MRALAIVHQPDAGPGVFAEAARERGVALDHWMIAVGGSPPDDPLSYDGVLVLGGAMHADQEASHPWLGEEKALLRTLIARRVPQLGVCLGSQLLAEAAGATARRAVRPEIGWFDVEVTGGGVDDPLIGPLAPRFRAFEWHSYEFSLPRGAVALARSAVCIQAFRLEDRPAWGIQFHAEVSPEGLDRWIDDYRNDEDAVTLGLDPEALREQSREAIGAWNAIGLELCGRFLDAAADARRARTTGRE